MARGKLREERAVMTTLAGLMMLSVLLACAALITRLVGSGDALIERAVAPHLAQLHSGEVDDREITEFTAAHPEITAHQVTPLLGIDDAQLFFDGTSQSSSVQQNSLMVPERERDLLLDMRDRPLTDVEPGTVWLPLLYESSGLTVGSTLTVTAPYGFRWELEVAGFLRDAGMGPAIAGSKRLAVSAEDLAVVAEGPVAALVLLAAAMVLVIGMLSLRLALRTSLERDRREIAVMTAIGISARDVRTLHLLVYGTLAAVAGLAGLLGGIALERVLSAGLTRFLGETGGAGVVLIPAAVSLLLVLGVLATAASLLRRGGSAPLLVTVFAVCTLLVMVPTSIATTLALASPQFSAYFGLGAADVRIDLPYTGKDSTSRFESARSALAGDARVTEHTALVTTRHLVETDEGEELGLAVSSGDRSATPGVYTDGRAPRSEGEIALSLLSLAEAGVSVGDRLPIQVQGQWSELEVVGSYQDLTNGGRTARGMLPTEGEQVIGYVFGAAVVSGAETAVVAGGLSAQLTEARVSETEVYRTQLLGSVGERIDAAAALAAAVAVTLAALLAVMISRLWLATDAAPLSIQRALGASPLTLRAPYLTRMLVTLVLGLAVGAALSLSLGQGLFNLLIEGMFGGMEHLFQGTSRIDLVLDPLLTGLAMPLLLAGVTTLATLWTCRRLRTADVRTLTAE